MTLKNDHFADFPVETISEGKTQILVPKLSAYGVSPADYAPSKAPVFYNPVMEFNRDLSVLVFRVYRRLINHQITICEPLTSQGIRGIRYATEIDNVKKIELSDINRRAYRLAKHNIKLNKIDDKIALKNKDANHVLSCHASPKKRFDIIDIDPFGSPVPFLDSAFQAIRNKGLLAVTATDLAPLCGVHSKACVRKYGGKPIRTEYCHEIAIRLLCSCLASVAAKHDIGIQILFSHSSDHYIRVYAQINYGCKKADETIKNIGYILHCSNCMHREITHQPFSNLTCSECGTKMDFAGPLWTGNLLDALFIDSLIRENQNISFKNSSKITKLLTQLANEASAPKTYFVIDKLSKKLNLPAPSNQAFLELLHKKGFEAVLTHFNRRGIKTNAPALVLHHVLEDLVTR